MAVFLLDQSNLYNHFPREIYERHYSWIKQQYLEDEWKKVMINRHETENERAEMQIHRVKTDFFSNIVQYLERSDVVSQLEISRLNRLIQEESVSQFFSI